MSEQEDNKLKLSLILLMKSSILTFIGVAFSKGLTYLYRAIIARQFGPEGYGLFSLAIMTLGWFVTFSDFGLTHGLMRYMALYRGKNQIEKIRYTFSFVKRTLLVPSIILGAALFLLSDYISLRFFNDIALSPFLKIFSILVPFSIYFYVYLTAIRAYEKIGWYSFIFNINQNVVKVVALVALIMFGASIASVPYSYALGIITSFFVAYVVCRVTMPQIFIKSTLPEKNKKKAVKDLVYYSVPLLFFSIVSTIFYWIDSFSIGYYKDVASVGLYTAVIPIATLLAIVPELFIQLFFPLINREYGRNNVPLIKELSKQVGKWIYMVNLPIFVLIILFPGAAINILFGAEYLPAVTSLRILAIGALISSTFSISNQLVSALGKTKLILLNIVIASIVNLALNSLFIPMDKIWFIDNTIGINGAAIATLLSLALFNSLLFAQSYYYLKVVPFRRRVLLITLAAILSAAILVYVKSFFVSNTLNIIFLSAGFFAIYGAMVLLFRGLDRNDLNIIKFFLFKRKAK